MPINDNTAKWKVRKVAGTTGEEQPTLLGEELANYAEVGRVGQVRVIFNLAEKKM